LRTNNIAVPKKKRNRAQVDNFSANTLRSSNKTSGIRHKPTIAAVYITSTLNLNRNHKINQNVKYAPARRQLLPKYYVKNDLVFVMKPKILYGKNACYFGGSKQEPYIMSDFYDEDINIPADWARMETKFRQLKKEKAE